MTHNPVSPSQRRPAQDAGTVLGTAADIAMRDRIFHLTRAQGAYAVPQWLDAASTGFALVGSRGERRVAGLGGRGGMPVVADVGGYEKNLATADEPMRYPEDTLFGADGFYNDMLTRSASVAFTPTSYIQAGDTASLKAVRTAAQQLGRSDVVVLMPLDVTWLRKATIDQLIAVLKTIDHVIALALGGQYNPTDHYVDIMANLRRVYEEVGRVGLWRTDPVTALDCMSHGGMFAGIGVSASLRHLPPAKDPVKGGGGGGKFKAPVFVPELLGYFRAEKLATLWANAEPLTCDCPVCGGKSLGRFDSTETVVVEEANAHNTASWARLWSQMHALPTLPERQRWYAHRLESAFGAYELENARIDQANGFKPSKTLNQLAKLLKTAEDPENGTVGDTPAR